MTFLLEFYRATVESVLAFSIIVWYGSLTRRDIERLDKVVNTASRIIGMKLPELSTLYHDRVVNRCNKILKDETHPANKIFELLPSGRRYRSLPAHANRMRDSFYAKAMTFLS